MNQESDKNTSKSLKESEKENTSTLKTSESTLKYKSIFSETSEKIIAKLEKSQRIKVLKKIEQILDNPFKEYKYLRHDLKGKNRVQIGHFVLIFGIDHENKTIYFYDYEHHDKIYH